MSFDKTSFPDSGLGTGGLDGSYGITKLVENSAITHRAYLVLVPVLEQGDRYRQVCWPKSNAEEIVYFLGLVSGISLVVVGSLGDFVAASY